MIPDLAIIVSVYAVMRLLNEYVLHDPKHVQLRAALSIVAIAVIAFFAFDVVLASGDLNL